MMMFFFIFSYCDEFVTLMTRIAFGKTRIYTDFYFATNYTNFRELFFTILRKKLVKIRVIRGRLFSTLQRN
ncbi:hypothetical protein AKO67_10330 [Flavobacterium sp. VMW]|nr:hypothetical protein AKO67_10330 [Flavobacterium sp. VMW]